MVDEDYAGFGLTGEVLTRTVEILGTAAIRAFARHALPDVPVPAARSLEQAVVPDARSIGAAIRSVMSR